MIRQRTTQPGFMVSIFDDPQGADSLLFTFVPKKTHPARAEIGLPKPVQEYILSLQGCGDRPKLKWIKAPAQEATRHELEAIAHDRLTARHAWLEKLGKLVATVQRWALELDWSPRVVNKKMEDAEIGNYNAPGLLMQRETVRLFLEPVARVAPGTEGVVDVYLMPAYDDIASLYHYDGRWNVHYLFEGDKAIGNIREAEAKPLTKATLRRVFDEMKAHAG